MPALHSLFLLTFLLYRCFHLIFEVLDHTRKTSIVKFAGVLSGMDFAKEDLHAKALSLSKKVSEHQFPGLQPRDLINANGAWNGRLNGLQQVLKSLRLAPDGEIAYHSSSSSSSGSVAGLLFPGPSLARHKFSSLLQYALVVEPSRASTQHTFDDSSPDLLSIHIPNDSARHNLILDSGAKKLHLGSSEQSSILELSEVTCTLLSYGFSAQDVSGQCYRDLESFLQDRASSSAADAPRHWSLSAQLALLLSGRQECHPLLDPRDGGSSNLASLQLRCMLHSINRKGHLLRIQALARGMCGEWSVAGLKAKAPNCSPLYAALHEVQALLDLLECWDAGVLPDYFYDTVYASTLTCFQYLTSVLKLQNTNGSWGAQPSSEESAYGLLVVIRLSGLPFLGQLQGVLGNAIHQGRAFLTSGYPHREYDQAPRLWSGSVPLGSANIGEAYTLAALQCGPVQLSRPGAVAGLAQIPYQRLPDLAAFYASLPLFAEAKHWIIQASLIEGYLLLPLLRNNFTLYSEKDSFRWLEYISFIFPACNNISREGGIVTETLVLVMGLMSILYQVDAFMEGLLEKGLIEGLAEIVGLIHQAFGLTEEDNTCGVDLLSWSRGAVIQNPQLRTPPTSPADSPNNEQHDYFSSKRLNHTHDTLNTFVRFLLDHSAVVGASQHDRHWFKTELYNFFIAQAGQVAEKAQLQGQVSELDSRPSSFNHGNRTSACYTSSTLTYRRWLASTGADSVGSPYQFAFFSILLAGGTGRDCWDTVEEKYLAQSASQGLATVWRIENDIGGIQRDRLDCTVNSVNFPEFATQRRNDEELKAQLLGLADHERRKWKQEMAQLKRLAAGNRTKEDRLSKVRVFTDAMELYGQIYIERDVWRAKADE